MSELNSAVQNLDAKNTSTHKGSKTNTEKPIRWNIKESPPYSFIQAVDDDSGETNAAWKNVPITVDQGGS